MNNVNTTSNTDNIVEVTGLKQYFPIKTGFFQTTDLKAVDDVSFTIAKGETLGLVGESGCGKTTVGRSLIRLHVPTAGKVVFNGTEMTEKNVTDMRRDMQMVFQDPYSSLNPRMTIEDIIAEPLIIHKLCDTKEARRARVLELLALVGLNPEHARRYAHEFSGGQRQRIGIARALAVDPAFIVCDESVSALDVSIQAQILNTFKSLQEKLNLSYLFIAHDILVITYMSDRVAVMYLGKIVELAETREINKNPTHPYTESLYSAVPIPDPVTAKQSRRIMLEGDVPSPLNLPSGCSFRNRCRYATGQCAEKTPLLTDRGGGHFVACWNR
jgi:oligopeptide transport system ATP-binding protein